MDSPFSPPRPALGRTTSKDSSSSLDDLFYLTPYIPLSNLPTPPASPDGPLRRPVVKDVDLGIDEDEVLDPDLLGPSYHLCNLVPPNTSTSRASPRLIHAFLSRADLPIETIALAACILDSLSTRFVQLWRRECLDCPRPLLSPPQSPLPSLETPNSAEFPSLSTILPSASQPLKPDLIILSSLLLSSHLHTDDHIDTWTTADYSNDIARGLFTCKQINATTRAVLRDLDYCLEPLGREDVIREMIAGFRLWGRRTGNHWDSTKH